MASDGIHTAEISIRDTITKAVTLAPERATIVREITDVPIKPGPNEITIYGFDREVDPDSFRVTGRGPATITDIQTLVDFQKELFDDVFPQNEDESDNKSSDQSEDSDDDFGVDRSELDKVEQELKQVEDALSSHRHEWETMTRSLGFLDSYGTSMAAQHVDVSKVRDYINVYQKERTRLGLESQHSSSAISELKKRKEKLIRTRGRLSRSFLSARDAAAEPLRKERNKKIMARTMKLKQKERAKDELRRFWPTHIGHAILYLDGFGEDSPGASRRNSIISAKGPQGTTANENTNSITLSLTYVTTKASWTPRYELNLKTPTSSGKVVYRAEYHNHSSETWKDAKVTLSTSQTSFSGINETIPHLPPWNVKLHKQEESLGNIEVKHMNNWKGGLENKDEVRARNNVGRKAFGANRPLKQAQQAQRHVQIMRRPQLEDDIKVEVDGMGLEAPRHRRANRHNTLSSPRFVNSSAGNNREGTVDFDVPVPRRNRQIPEYFVNSSNESDSDDDEDEDDDTATLCGSSNVLAFQESSRHDYGLTTTYDIPGQRTFKPSSHKRRHIIAELDVSSITFSHVIIPKLRSAAFLKASIANTSSTTLLRGKAGLTLDGAFLGTTTVPSCGPQTSFSLSLGVDPGIQVTYAKPTVRRATTGFFNKEDCAIFTRVCRINNTKGTAVSLMVYDQIPVSEDERLRIRVIEPKGISTEGDSANLGADICANASKTKDWGKGDVRMGKNGEVRWQITLEKGAEIKLALEYDARIPSGQKMVGLY